MTTDSLTVAVLLPEQPDHGVVRHARHLASRLDELDAIEVELVDVPCGRGAVDAARRAWERANRRDVVHLQLTDRLYGADAEEAALVLAELLDAMPGPTIVTLHDVPAPEDECERYERRGRLYREVAGRVEAVVVSSEHERRLAELLGITSEVIPLPIGADGPVVTGRRRGGNGPLTVGVLGFVYPGKGHDDVLAAMALLAEPACLVCIGRISDGHDDLADDLQRRADAAGVGLRLTGFVPDARLGEELAAVDVPVVPNRHPSASASLCTWVAHARRPLIRDGEYAREFSARWPGAVTCYAGDDPRQLAGRIRRAAVDPRTTWTHGATSGPTLTETARRHVDVFRRAIATRVR
jgi:glycosyltransferase involved in cell wall biosynthesis